MREYKFLTLLEAPHLVVVSGAEVPDLNLLSNAHLSVTISESIRERMSYPSSLFPCVFSTDSDNVQFERQ